VRMITPMTVLALLALISCSGCASGHPRSGPDAIYPGYMTSPSYEGESPVVQTLSDASMNDWNFKALSR
jgi:hypothetical protein